MFCYFDNLNLARLQLSKCCLFGENIFGLFPQWIHIAKHLIKTSFRGCIWGNRLCNDEISAGISVGCSSDRHKFSPFVIRWVQQVQNSVFFFPVLNLWVLIKDFNEIFCKVSILIKILASFSVVFTSLVYSEFAFWKLRWKLFLKWMEIFEVLQNFKNFSTGVIP